MDRHEESIKYALNVLTGRFSQYVMKVILFGSCARQTNKFTSDVDLLIQVTTDTTPKIMRQMRVLATPDDYELPEVELKFVKGPLIFSSRQFAKNIEREGVVLWKKK